MSITGLAYLLLTSGFGFFSWIFFKSWQKTEISTGGKSEVGRWLFYFFVIFTLLCLLAAIGGLFFSKHIPILRGVVIATSLLLVLGSAAAAYLVFYLLFPKVSPWYGYFGLLFLGSMTTLLTFFLPFEPFLETNWGINWGLSPLVSSLRFSLYLITFFPLSIVFLRQFFFSTDEKDTKIKSLALTLIFSFGLIIAYIEFILEPALGLPAVTSDIFVILLSIVLLWLVLLPRLSTESN